MFAEHRVEQLTVTIDRAVQVAPAPRDLHVRLVEIPGPPGTSLSPRAELIADEWCEAELPGADRLVADGVATLEQKFGDVSQPELVAQTPENGEQDDVRRELQFVERRTGALVEASLATGA